MNIPDIVTMLNNVAQSFVPVEQMFKGFSYVLGLVFVFAALVKLYGMSNKVGHQGHGKILVPFGYLLAGAGMLLLPQFTQVVSNTLFGSGNIMAYLPKQSLSGAVLQSMTIILKAVGILWFIRGCVLLAHAGSPGDIKDCSKKGILFLIAGILAINLDATGQVLGSFMSKLTHLFSGSAPSG